MNARTRRARRSGWTWMAVVGVAVAAGVFFWGRMAFRQESYSPSAFYQVKRGDMLISIIEEGALRALNETVVRSALEGINRVIYLVPEGSYVEKGDLLVELDSSALRDRFNEQELLYQERLFLFHQATGNLKIQKSLAESQIKDAELKVENAQGDLEKYRDGDAPLLLKTVEARSGVLAEQVRIASERYARTQELFKKGNATKSELEADALSLKREQLALSQYEEDLRLIKKYDQPNQLRLLQSNVEQAQAELARLKQRTSNEIAQAEADLKTSKAALDVLEAGLKTQQRRLESAKIIAPQNGLVVYAPVSPFQFSSDEDRRRDEGRFRSRSGRGDDGGGEFRWGGRRGGRSSFESSSSSSGGSGNAGGSGGSGSSSTAGTLAAGNQRIASAVSGTAATESSGSGTGGGGASSSGTSGGSSSGGRSGGGGLSGGGGGGQSTFNAASVFASYASLRPSSLFGAAGASSNDPASSPSTSTSAGSSGGQGSSSGGGSQFGSGNQFSSRSQSYQDFGFDYYGTPGLLQEGTMVRQRQELIRLPDVSKMLAEIKISEARVRQVRAGMTAYVQVHNIPHRRFKGTVRRVALLPDSLSSWMNPNVKLFPADILVDEEMPLLRPGVSASTEIVITNLTNVLSVPIQTVARWRGENVCFVKRGARVTPLPVTTGWYNDAFIEVTSGLKEGDLVLLAPMSDETVEETPTTETNQTENATEEGPPAEQSPRGDPEFRRREPSDGSPRGQPFDSSRRGDPSDVPRRGAVNEPSRGPDSRRDPSDSPRQRESFDSMRDGQEPPAEGQGRRFRRRDPGNPGTDGAPRRPVSEEPPQ